MSGFPNIQDIALLREALASIAVEDEEIVRASREIERAHEDKAQASSRRETALHTVDTLMAKMDCAQTGNHGYRNRLLALLAGLVQHSEAYGRMHP